MLFSIVTGEIRGQRLWRDLLTPVRVQWGPGPQGLGHRGLSSHCFPGNSKEKDRGQEAKDNVLNLLGV